MTNKTFFKIVIKALLSFIETLVDFFQEEIGGGKEEEEPQLCYFPMEHLRTTQSERTGSHLNSLAMDFGGKDVFKDVCFAPCDLKVIRVRENANGEIYFESLKPVKFADGTKDYLHLLMLHDNNTFKWKVGDTIKQFQPFYQEGGMFGGDPCHYANHVHIEAGKGVWINPIQSKNSSGVWVCENQEHLYNIFYLRKETIVHDINTPFKYEP